MSGLRVLAVDDEPRALADVQRLLEGSARVAQVDTAGGGREALVRLGEGSYDALFLDVRMPEIEGLELARLLRRFDDPPGVVFLTGHADAAVEAFEVQALDFLVKPVTRERLDGALSRIEAARAARGGPAPAAREHTAPEVVALDNPVGAGKRLVRLETIRYVDADGDYARIHADDGDFVLRAPLSQLEEDWGSAGFTRVHRAHLVNLNHAVELRSQPNGTAVLAMRDGTEIPVARRTVAALRRRLKA
ncbi:MAG TPA: LytTR family DNA-binding domain-containing protein [Solirubrobacteraceae bacterium]